MAEQMCCALVEQEVQVVIHEITQDRHPCLFERDAIPFTAHTVHLMIIRHSAKGMASRMLQQALSARFVLFMATICSSSSMKETTPQ